MALYGGSGTADSAKARWVYYTQDDRVYDLAVSTAAFFTRTKGKLSPASDQYDRDAHLRESSANRRQAITEEYGRRTRTSLLQQTPAVKDSCHESAAVHIWVGASVVFLSAVDIFTLQYCELLVPILPKHQRTTLYINAVRALTKRCGKVEVQENTIEGKENRKANAPALRTP